jgi:hypothetical protein
MLFGSNIVMARIQDIWSMTFMEKISHSVNGTHAGRWTGKSASIIATSEKWAYIVSYKVYSIYDEY